MPRISCPEHSSPRPYLLNQEPPQLCPLSLSRRHGALWGEVLQGSIQPWTAAGNPETSVQYITFSYAGVPRHRTNPPQTPAPALWPGLSKICQEGQIVLSASRSGTSSCHMQKDGVGTLPRTCLVAVDACICVGAKGGQSTDLHEKGANVLRIHQEGAMVPGRVTRVSN